MVCSRPSLSGGEVLSHVPLILLLEPTGSQLQWVVGGNERVTKRVWMIPLRNLAVRTETESVNWSLCDHSYGSPKE